MSKLSIETCAKALNGAAMNRKAAFQIELATGLAVYAINNGTNKDARTMLCSAYAAAGYQCLKTDGIDYKTINRRINATADLYNTLRGEKVAKWVGKHNESQMIDALVVGLAPYELHAVRDVERMCAPPEPAQKPQQRIAPASDILAGPATGQQQVIDMFKRAASEVAKGARHIETEHLALMVPDTATRDELVQMAQRLLVLAEERRQELTPA